MIKPVNGHLLIDPVKQDGFMASQQETYQEVGIVVAGADELMGVETFKEIAPNKLKVTQEGAKVNVGDKVYFDSWLAAKYPKGDGDEYYWLVKWEDVRAIEYVEPTVSE